MSQQGDPPPGTSWERVACLAELGLMTQALVHELRQPLFAIKAGMELELVAAQPAAARRLSTLLAQVAHLEEIVGRYTGFGVQEGEVAICDLAVPARAAMDMMAHRARQVGAVLRGSFGDRACWVRASEGALRQIAVNLIGNALDAVDGCEARAVDLWIGHEGGVVMLEVRDTGPGIPTRLRGRVFDAFFTTKPLGQGTGLGLFITRKLVQEAGGTIEVGPEGAHGTVVRVALPLVDLGR